VEGDPKDGGDTVRHERTLLGVSKEAAKEAATEDQGSADTALADSTPSPSTSRRDRETEPPPMDIDERYTLNKVLGQGGMGEVVSAVDERIGREVAVKRIRRDQPSEEERSRFVREARIQGRLEHPAIVPVHDLATDATGRPFFVMKRLTGVDMHETLRALRSGEITGDEAAATRRRLLRAFAEVCIAVAFAHSKGIIHRDLKPANIMLGGYGEVYILDWGVARAADDADDRVAAPSGRQDLALATGDTQAGAVLGTPAYMAPEQLVGDHVDGRSDIYALGCILYEIAAGEPVHPRTRSLGEALEPIDGRPSKRRPDSPPEIDAICERALRVEPSERWENARELGDAVQGFLDGDRDLVVRQELAAHHVADARAAIARSRDDESRRRAMQAAGRALALDPKNTEAADLIGRLMLEPPDKVPDEVEEHLAEIDVTTARSQGRLAAAAVTGYLAFVPFLVWSGVHDVRYIAAFVALALASGVQVLLLTRRSHLTTTPIYLNACINAALIGVVCRMVGPFIIAPTLVLTTLMAYSSHPRFGRISILALILSASVVVPWVLELLGILDSTFRFENGEIVLSSPVVRFSSVPTQLAFALLLVSLVGVVAALSRALARRQRDAARQLELQAWQLKQIVPAGPG
jgi:serine/threonine-protein kinase